MSTAVAESGERSPAGAMKLPHVEMIGDAAGFAALEGEWNGLLKRSGTSDFFLGFSWLFRLWSDTGGDGRLVLAVARGTDGAALAIAPLEIVRVEGFRRLGFIGCSLSDSEDFIVDRDHARPAIDAILAALLERRDWDFFQLTRLRTDSPNFSILASLTEGWRGGSRITPFEVVPFARLTTGWQDHWKAFDVKLRRDTTRRHRKLAEEIGPVSFIEPQQEQEIAPLLDGLITLHRARRGKRDYSLFEDPALCRFFHEAAVDAFRAGTLSLVAMRAGERTVASHLSFVQGGTYRCLLTAFDEELKRYAPGRLMLVHLIELCYRLRLSTFDLGMGSEPYKFQFVSETCELQSMTLCHATPGGMLAHLWFNLARNQLRRFDRLRTLAVQWRRAGLARRTGLPNRET